MQTLRGAPGACRTVYEQAITIRRSAAWALIFYALTAALVAMTYAFPLWGAPQGELFIYLPPQACIALVTGGIVVLLDLYVAVRSMAAGLARRGGIWRLTFLFLLAAALCGPTLTCVQLGNSRVISLGPDATATVLLVAAAGMLLIPLLGLQYACRLLRASTPGAIG